MWEGSEMARWRRWESGEVERWGLLVLPKGGECRVTPRFHLFDSDVNQGKEKVGWIQDFLVCRRKRKTLL